MEPYVPPRTFVPPSVWLAPKTDVWATEISEHAPAPAAALAAPPTADSVAIVGHLAMGGETLGSFPEGPAGLLAAAREGCVITVTVASASGLFVFGPSIGARFTGPPIATSGTAPMVTFVAPADGHYLVTMRGFVGATFTARARCAGDACQPPALDSVTCPPAFVDDVDACIGALRTDEPSLSVPECAARCADAEPLADAYDAECGGSERMVTCGMSYESVWRALETPCRVAGLHAHEAAPCRFGTRVADLFGPGRPFVVVSDERLTSVDAPRLGDVGAAQLVRAIAPLAPTVASALDAFRAADGGQVRRALLVDLGGAPLSLFEFGLGDQMIAVLFEGASNEPTARATGGDWEACDARAQYGLACARDDECGAGLGCVGVALGLGRCAALPLATDFELRCAPGPESCPEGLACLPLLPGEPGLCAPAWSSGGASDIPLATIPDLSFVERRLVVRGVGALARAVWVRARITHPQPDTLRVVLTAPGGQSAVVFDELPGPDGWIVDRPVPELTGAYPARGEWSIRVEDHSPGGVGYLEAWEIRVVGTD